MGNRSDISENFIPYELALKLKELGFNEECFGVYVNGNFEPRYRSRNSKFNPNNKLDKRNLEFCTAPLYQQAFDWFREKHYFDLHFKPMTIVGHTCYYDIEIYHPKYVWDKPPKVSGKTYQEARQACLEKLIEMVENNERKT